MNLATHQSSAQQSADICEQNTLPDCGHGVLWLNVMNEGLQATTGQEDTGASIKERKWKCIGHIFRKERLLTGILYGGE